MQGEGTATKTQSSSNLAQGLERIRNTPANIAEEEARLEKKIGQVISVKGTDARNDSKRLSCQTFEKILLKTGAEKKRNTGSSGTGMTLKNN